MGRTISARVAVTALMVAGSSTAGCDNNASHPGGQAGLSGSGGGISLGTGGQVGSGGQVETGGRAATGGGQVGGGGQIGSAGQVGNGSGGQADTGGQIGNGSGGRVASGGQVGNGSGGQVGGGGQPDSGGRVGTGGGTAGAGAGGMSGGCGSGANLGIAMHPSEGGTHLVVCSPTSYGTVPPSSGPHYPYWPAYKTYTQPVPWGFLVHGLEHGAVIAVYNCPGGCPAEVAAAQKWIDALPTDTDAYCPGEKPRVILVPDPTLDVRWAATAWTWTLRACAFDAPTFQQFFLDHYDMTYEPGICRGNSEVDLSASGWCN